MIFQLQFQLFLFFLFQLVLQLFIFPVTVTVILTRGISVHMTVSVLYTHEQHRAQTSQLPQFLYCILLASKLNVTFTKLYNVNLLIVLTVHFYKVRRSKFLEGRFLFPAVKSPQTENTLSTYASDAGADMMSCAKGASRGKVPSDLTQKFNPVDSV